MRGVLNSCMLTLLLLVAAAAAMAVQPDEMLQDPALEARARALSRDLRCMVCQNQSIDDSDAPLARELRILVRDQIKAGASDQQVLDYLVARYGEFVLLRPRFALHTALLWLITPVALVSGAVVLLVIARRRSAVPAEARQLTPNETERLTRLLESDNK